MADTQIEWTDATWNPVAGCSLVSAGCTNCYAMKMAKRLELMGVAKYKNLTKKTGNTVTWRGTVREDRASLHTPYKWKKPRKIFVNSMSDLFHEKVSDDFILKIWQVMQETPQHHYQILTKRPARMQQMLSNKINTVLPNVWLGTSVENAKAVDRIDHLRATPAAIRFISFEPLIGAVGRVNLKNIDWAIVGGESGHNARIVKEHWIDEIYAQCNVYHATFFFKQWGAWGQDSKKRSKKANGRQYLGKVWNEMPPTNQVQYFNLA